MIIALKPDRIQMKFRGIELFGLIITTKKQLENASEEWFVDNINNVKIIKGEGEEQCSQ
jgi:hypothetical protein